MKDKKINGFSAIRHYEKITEEDMKIIVDTLDTDSPVQLQWLCFFFIHLFFCRRGLENSEKLQKSDFQTSIDQKGRKYICYGKDELTKNNRESELERRQEGRMYERMGDNKCPVLVFEKYVAKLNPNSDRLWQYAKGAFLENEDSWFTAKPIGRHGIEKFMASISSFCHLSKRYTNHCIRVTCISQLADHFSENEVKSVSGHNSLGSLGIYKRLSDEKRFQMSNELGFSNKRKVQTDQVDLDQYGPSKMQKAEQVININNYGVINIHK